MQITQTYRLTAGLLVRNTSGDHAAMPTIEGEGTGELRADFAAGPILDVDGSSHTPYKFLRGGGVRGLRFRETAAGVDVTGIRHAGWWDAALDGLSMSGLSGHGLHFPDHSADIDPNPDAWASQHWSVARCTITGCGGWGILDEGGIGWGKVSIERSTVSLNAAGGVKLSGHAWTIRHNSVAANGGAAGTGGLTVERQLGNHPHNHIIEDNEFDGNFDHHILLEGCQGGRVSHNRLIHHEDNAWADSTNRPPRAVVFGLAATSATSQVTRVSCERNFHRSDTALGTPVTAYEFAHVNAGPYCRLVDNNFPADNTAALTKYAGQTLPVAGQEPYIVDAGNVVSGSLHRLDAEALVIGAADMHGLMGSPSLVNPSANAPTWYMDSATAEGVGGMVELPSTWATYDVELVWMNSAASVGDVAWQYVHRTLADGGTVGGSTSQTVAVQAAPTAASGVKRSVIASGIAITEPLMTFRIDREAADAGDTLANDAGVIGVRFVKAS